jgi:hypothetical protein
VFAFGVAAVSTGRAEAGAEIVAALTGAEVIDGVDDMLGDSDRSSPAVLSSPAPPAAEQPPATPSTSAGVTRFAQKNASKRERGTETFLKVASQSTLGAALHRAVAASRRLPSPMQHGTSDVHLVPARSISRQPQGNNSSDRS